MANIYDVAGALQQPNIVNAVQQGVQTARQNAMGNIALQQAQQAQTDQQTARGLAPQVVAGDQSAYQQLAAIDPDKATALQGVDDAKYRRMNGAINFVESQTTPQAKQAAWAQARPYFAQLGGVDISQVPEDVNAAQPGFQAVKAHLASLPVNSTTLTPGSVLANKDTGAVLYNNQAGDKFYQAPIGPNGEKALVAVNPHGGGQGSIVSLGGSGTPANGMASPDFYNAVNDLSSKYGATITSGVRSPEHNAEVGGVPNSQHLSGTAADVVIPPDQKAQFIQDAKARGLQPIDEGDHVHLQNPNGGAGVSGMRLAVGTPAPKTNSWQQRIDVAKSLGASSEQLQGMVLGASGMNNAQSSDLSPGALENATVNYMLTGVLPPIGRGGQGQAQRTAIMNHAADMAAASGVTPAELSTRGGQQKALQGSLNAYQKRADAMAGQENAFLNNLDQAQKISDLVDRTRSPAINRFLQTGEFESGDQDVAALRAALIPVAADYAKIMSGATGAGGTPVSTMEEALSLIRADLSKGQFSTVAQVLRNDVHNQRLGSLQQLHAIRDNMSRFGNGTQGGTTAKQTPQQEMAPTPNLPGQNTAPAGQQDFSHLWGGG
jgi:hypothetical protein